MDKPKISNKSIVEIQGKINEEQARLHKQARDVPATKTEGFRKDRE